MHCADRGVQKNRQEVGMVEHVEAASRCGKGRLCGTGHRPHSPAIWHSPLYAYERSRTQTVQEQARLLNPRAQRYEYTHARLYRSKIAQSARTTLRVHTCTCDVSEAAAQRFQRQFTACLQLPRASNENIDFSWLVKIRFSPNHTPFVPAARPGVFSKSDNDDNDAPPPLGQRLVLRFVTSDLCKPLVTLQLEHLLGRGLCSFGDFDGVRKWAAQEGGPMAHGLFGSL